MYRHVRAGAANLINGVADAAQDRVPLLVITSQVESWYVGTNHKQYFDHLSLYRPFTTYTTMLANPQSTVEVLTHAIKAAVTGRMVSHVSIPKDLFAMAAPAAIRPPETYLLTRPISPPEVIDGVLPILNQARQPVILAGRGTKGYTAELTAFAEQWGAGIVHTMPATGVVPCAHPLPWEVSA